MGTSDGRDLSDEAAQHRSAETHFLGKCDDFLEVGMPAEMKRDLAALAQISEPKTTPTALARRILSDFLYGRIRSIRASIDN